MCVILSEPIIATILYIFCPSTRSTVGKIISCHKKQNCHIFLYKIILSCKLTKQSCICKNKQNYLKEIGYFLLQQEKNIYLVDYIYFYLILYILILYYIFHHCAKADPFFRARTHSVIRIS